MAQAGDEDAYASLLVLLTAATRRFARGRVGNVAWIDDVVQDTLMTMHRARATYDPVTHRNYRADSGAAIVLQAKTGRVVAMASQPTYNPAEWVGGISRAQLARRIRHEFRAVARGQHAQIL